MHKIKKTTVCLNMAGCPNRCKHCWIGKSTNCNLSIEDLIFVEQEFRKVSENLELYSWYKEPDYHPEYKALYDFEMLHSNFHQKHYELISYYRAVRDETYIPWLKKIGLKKTQLTFFGLEEKTDFYVGRIGAFNELLITIEKLLNNGIVPRIQIFTYTDNIMQMQDLINIFHKLELEKRCSEIGEKFELFIHQGSAMGESMALVEEKKWIKESDLIKIPLYIKEKTFAHLNTNTYSGVFGYPEKELYKRFLMEKPQYNFISKEPCFYVDEKFNVYPNISETSKSWLLGNLKKDVINEIINNYYNSSSIAQNAYLNISFKEMLLKCGDENGEMLFDAKDYVIYILEKYVKENLLIS